MSWPNLAGGFSRFPARGQAEEVVDLLEAGE